MFLSSDVFSLLLYCTQQLGIALGIGAQTIILVAYLSATKDGIIDKAEAQFARAVKRILRIGLILVLVSGLLITVTHILAHSVDPNTGNPVIYVPNFLFKWLLVLIVLGLSFTKTYSRHFIEGLSGGTWYALFLVHTLAVVATWENLITLYVVWMVGFLLCWMVLVFSTAKVVKHDEVTVSVKEIPQPVQKTVVTPPPAVKPIPPPAPKAVPPPAPVTVVKVAPPPPPVVPKPLPPPPPPVVKPEPPPAPPPKPAPITPAPDKHILQTLPQPEINKTHPVSHVDLVVDDGAVSFNADQNPWLPAVHVMPKTPADLERRMNPTPPGQTSASAKPPPPPHATATPPPQPPHATITPPASPAPVTPPPPPPHAIAPLPPPHAAGEPPHNLPTAPLPPPVVIPKLPPHA